MGSGVMSGMCIIINTLASRLPSDNYVVCERGKETCSRGNDKVNERKPKQRSE